MVDNVRFTVKWNKPKTAHYMYLALEIESGHYFKNGIINLFLYTCFVQVFFCCLTLSSLSTTPETEQFYYLPVVAMAEFPFANQQARARFSSLSAFYVYSALILA